MTLDCALHDAIFAVVAQVENGQMPADHAVDVLDCLYRLMQTAGNKEPDKENQSQLEKDLWLTKEQIARKLHIFHAGSHCAPAISAVGAIIGHLLLKREEIDRYDFDVPLYAPSVVQKVCNWLEENNYPEVITATNGAEHYVYYDKEGSEL